jgi:hypothetical protein
MRRDDAADAHFARTIELLEHAAYERTDFDIATLIFHLFSGKYRYCGSDTWERYDGPSKTWRADPQGAKFADEAIQRVYGLALDRANYWQAIAIDYLENADNDELHADFGQCGLSNSGDKAEAKANRLLSFSNYIQKPATSRSIIDECRAFFEGI